MVWSLEDGKERAKLSGHNGDVVAVDFSPDGKFLASGSAGRSGVVKLWDSTTFQLINTPSGREGGVDLVGFSPDGKTLIGANAAGLVTLWDVPSGKARATFNHPGGMNQIVISHDGKTLATGGGKVGRGAEQFPGPGEIRLWDVASGRRLAVLSVPAGRIIRLAFTPTTRPWQRRPRARPSCFGTSRRPPSAPHCHGNPVRPSPSPSLPTARPSLRAERITCSASGMPRPVFSARHSADTPTRLTGSPSPRTAAPSSRLAGTPQPSSGTSRPEQIDATRPGRAPMFFLVAARELTLPARLGIAKLRIDRQSRRTVRSWARTSSSVTIRCSSTACRTSRPISVADRASARLTGGGVVDSDRTDVRNASSAKRVSD